MKSQILGLLVLLVSTTVVRAQGGIFPEGMRLKDMRCSVSYLAFQREDDSWPVFTPLRLSHYSYGISPTVDENGIEVIDGGFFLRKEQYDPDLTQHIRLLPDSSDSIRPIDLGFIPRFEFSVFVGYEIRLGHVRSEILEEGRTKDERIINALKRRLGEKELRDEYYYSAVSGFIPLRAGGSIELNLMSKNARVRSIHLKCMIPETLEQFK